MRRPPTAALCRESARGSSRRCFLRPAAPVVVFIQLTEAIGQFIFVADIGEALHLARARGGNHHLRAALTRPRTSFMNAATLP